MFFAYCELSPENFVVYLVLYFFFANDLTWNICQCRMCLWLSTQMLTRRRRVFSSSFWSLFISLRLWVEDVSRANSHYFGYCGSRLENDSEKKATTSNLNHLLLLFCTHKWLVKTILNETKWFSSFARWNSVGLIFCRIFQITFDTDIYFTSDHWQKRSTTQDKLKSFQETIRSLRKILKT